jgi:hypothetical protein
MARRVLRLFTSVSSLQLWDSDKVTFQLSFHGELVWWQSILAGGTPKAEATFWGHLIFMRMKEGQTFLGGWCTRCILYTVYAVFGVCCIWCKVYLVYAVLGLCCAWSMLYSVYVVLGICWAQG